MKRPDRAVEFSDLVSEMSAALEEELVAVRESEAARRIPLFAGRCVGQAGADWLYTFSLQFPATLPDDVPLRLELASGDAYTGQLLSSTAFEVTLACGARLPEKLGSASLSLDTSFLLEQLLLRLSELRAEDCDLAMALFGFRAPYAAAHAGLPDDAQANEFQLEALRAVLERDVTYVWGPPGTGKTTCLALIAEALIERGMRVLAVASTNVAVDNAVLKVSERVADDGPVVRYGTPQLAALREHAPERRGLFDPLPLENGAGVTVLPAKRLPDPREEAARVRALKQAQVVGATLARLALAPELDWPGFDAVLLDEASAAPLPAVFLAAALARSKMVVLGDPKQLPPVAQANGPLARRWLQRDVFAQAGLEDDDERAVLLREQYRMPAGISGLANELVYGGRLIDAPGLRGRHGGARLVDTSSEGGHCERQDGSRLNRVHAELAVEIAAELAGGGSVGIITPYRAQSRLVWRLLRQRRLEKTVDVGTVHRFQGLERQAIVFDTVEAPPVQPAPFVSGGYGSEAMRLINVAITRAQIELVVIANVTHLGHTLRRGSTLLGLLGLLRD